MNQRDVLWYLFVTCLPPLCVSSMQGKRLPAYLSADAEEGEVSDDDSADEIEEDFKLKSSNVRKEWGCKCCLDVTM